MTRTILGTVFLGLFCCIFSPAQTVLSFEQQQLFDLLNQERASAGLPKLRWDDHLAKSATAHAQAMVKYKELSHQFPGEPSPAERIAATGLRFSAAAENVAYAPTIEQVHDSLMHSPPHRANILSPDYNAVGFGILEGDHELFVAQNFANIVHVYSEQEFQDAVIDAFNRTRKSFGLTAIDVRNDVVTYSALRDAACAQVTDPNKIIQELPEVINVEIFTLSIPDKLPDHVQKTAANSQLKHMSLAVCFRPGSEHGFASFEVIAAFYPDPRKLPSR